MMKTAKKATIAPTNKSPAKAIKGTNKSSSEQINNHIIQLEAFLPVIRELQDASSPPPREFRLIARRVLGLIIKWSETDSDIGNLLVDYAHSFTLRFMGLCRKAPPQWFVDRAKTLLYVPWLMIRGAPGSSQVGSYKETNIHMNWGSKAAKPTGKSQVNAPATFNVLHTLLEIAEWRERLSDEERKSFIAHMRKEDRQKPDNLWRTNLYKSLTSLPPLNADSHDLWWRTIQPLIRSYAIITTSMEVEIRGSIPDATPAQIMNEYMKRCKKSFRALIPSG